MGEGSRASASKRFICLLGCGAVGKKNGNILFSAGIGVTAGFRHKVSGGVGSMDKTSLETKAVTTATDFDTLKRCSCQ